MKSFFQIRNGVENDDDTNKNNSANIHNNADSKCFKRVNTRDSMQVGTRSRRKLLLYTIKLYHWSYNNKNKRCLIVTTLHQYVFLVSLKNTNSRHKIGYHMFAFISGKITHFDKYRIFNGLTLTDGIYFIRDTAFLYLLEC